MRGVRPFFLILIDNESNMATNLAQLHSIVATAGTKLSNILSDELDKMSDEITKLSDILSDELEKIISSPGLSKSFEA